ncbi:MAG: hypothetical protein WD602_06285 [Actinomycetota bacterium]
MSDSENTPPDSSAVEEALNKIPGLADKVGSEPKAEETDSLSSDEPAEEQEPEGVAAEHPDVEDSDAVQAALNQIPGLKDKLGG